MNYSFDVGYSDTKIAIMDNSGKISKVFKEINSIAELGTDESVGKKYEGISMSDLIHHDGKYYMVGYSSLQYSDNKMMTVTSYEDMKKISPIVVKRYIKGDNYDKIILTLSAAFMEQEEDYLNYMTEQLNVDPSKIKIIPQGASCKVALDKVGLDINNPSQKVILKNYLLLDIGFNTIDAGLVINGTLMPTDIRGYAGEGIIRIANEIINMFKERGMNISLSRAKSLIKDKVFVQRGVTTDLSKEIDQFVVNYLNSLHDFIEEKYGETLDTIQNVVLFGGGAEVIRTKNDIWKTMYSGDFVLMPVSDAEYYNAIGGLYRF